MENEHEVTELYESEAIFHDDAIDAELGYPEEHEYYED